MLCLFTVHCTCRQDLRNWRSCKWNRCSFEIFCLGNENTRFYLAKTKQSSYNLNLSHESIYFRIYVGFPHPGLNVSPNIFSPAFFLVSTDARNSPSVCSDLPMWSTVMRTTVLYYFICNAIYIYIQNVCISGIILFITFVGMSKTFYTVILW